jgi:hypothetical protein
MGGCNGHCSWCRLRVVGALCHGPACQCDPSKGTPEYVLKREEAERAKQAQPVPETDRMKHDTMLKLLGYSVLFGYSSKNGLGLEVFWNEYLGIDTKAVGSDIVRYATEEQGQAALYKCSTTGY